MKKILFWRVMLSASLGGALTLANPAVAGELDPSGPPAPTMKTLQEIYDEPVWRLDDYVFEDWSDNPRFAVSAGEYPASDVDDMVLDKETGLIWTRNGHVPGYLPAGFLSEDSTSDPEGPFTLPEASEYCHRLDLNDRKGWRLGTVEELSSLMDMSVPGLPAGHPFINIQYGGMPYWSSTANVLNRIRFWFVFPDSGFVSHYGLLNKAHVLCVRGGSGRIAGEF